MYYKKDGYYLTDKTLYRKTAVINGFETETISPSH